MSAAAGGGTPGSTDTVRWKKSESERRKIAAKKKKLPTKLMTHKRRKVQRQGK